MTIRGENLPRKDKVERKMAVNMNKRGYVKPVLKEYGHLSKLTQKVAGGADGAKSP